MTPTATGTYELPLRPYPLYGPTPLDPYSSDWVRDHQRDVAAYYDTMLQEVKRAQSLGGSAVRAMELHLLSSLPVHEGISYKNYSNTLENGGFADEQRHVLELAKNGLASPDELIDLIQATPSLKSLELTRITHPYSMGLEQVPKMRESVLRHVPENMHHEKNQERPYRKIRVHTFIDTEARSGQQIYDNSPDALFVTYKRTLATLPDRHFSEDVIDIVERQGAVIDLDIQHGFDQKVLRKLENAVNSKEKRYKDWGDVYRSTGVKEFVETAVQCDSAEPFFIPAATSIYAARRHIDSDR